MFAHGRLSGSSSRVQHYDLQRFQELDDLVLVSVVQRLEGKLAFRGLAAVGKRGSPECRELAMVEIPPLGRRTLAFLREELVIAAQEAGRAGRERPVLAGDTMTFAFADVAGAPCPVMPAWLSSGAMLLPPPHRSVPVRKHRAS
jgi:hypothetical protein